MSYRIRTVDDFFRVIEKERKRQEKSTRAVSDEANMSTATYSASKRGNSCNLKTAIAYAKVMGLEMRLEWPSSSR
jgi:hypothetical protein